jgi:hypothetical protein
MILFDASAAAKRYFQEIGSERVNGEPVLFVSAVRQLLQAAQAEGLRALNPETAP